MDDLDYALTRWQNAMDERTKATSIALSNDPKLPETSRLMAIAAQVGWQIQVIEYDALIEHIKLKVPTV